VSLKKNIDKAAKLIQLRLCLQRLRDLAKQYNKKNLINEIKGDIRDQKIQEIIMNSYKNEIFKITN